MLSLQRNVPAVLVRLYFAAAVQGSLIEWHGTSHTAHGSATARSLARQILRRLEATPEVARTLGG